MVTPVIATYDLTISDKTTDNALLTTWLGTLTFTHVYGFQVTPVSNSRLRYSVIFD